MRIGVINKSNSKTVYEYISDRYKTFLQYPESEYAQYEIIGDTDSRAYSWDGFNAVYDSGWVEPSLDASVMAARSIRDAIAYGQNLIVEFAGENVAMGIIQLDKTTDVLAIMTEKVILTGATRPISIMDSVTSGSLYETLKLIDYHISNMANYTDLAPFITTDRLNAFKAKIAAYLGV